ncbi:MAG TPA: toxin-antitoxin system HicB family antitoxin [Cyanothece sp. UBA12306]|nr:toxin-antitoxin system HicB family antitoxin [Cyanothece sp. UBA12306]
MSRLTLRLPETLHQQLSHLAEDEGVSLNQYIVYALTRQVASNYTMVVSDKIALAQQNQEFGDLLAQLGQAIPSEIEATLSKREQVEPESQLTPQVVNQWKQLLQDKSQSFD